MKWPSSGNARVSTTEQNLDLQLSALKAAGAGRVFADQGVSGSAAERPQLSKALDRLEANDVLTVWKLDRLGRNTRHILDVVETLRERGVGFRSLTEGMDTTGAMGTAMLTIMAAFAQLERDTMIERTRAGLAAAAAEGPEKSTIRLLPERGNSRTKESVPATSARCWGSPAQRSTAISIRGRLGWGYGHSLGHHPGPALP